MTSHAGLAFAPPPAPDAASRGAARRGARLPRRANCANRAITEARRMPGAAAIREFSRKMGARGWIGMTWPKRYGGHERSALERYVVLEEMLAAGAPVSGHWVADRQSGPLLLRVGTEAQKQAILPRIAAGECSLLHRHERARFRLRPRLGAHARGSGARAAFASTAPSCGPPTRIAPTT